MITIKDLCFSYEETLILDTISLSVERGDFILLCGAKGSGKTTFLRHLKNELLPIGSRTGNIFFEGEKIENLNTSSDVGYVFQNPDHQIVSDRFYHELAFGLENQGMEITLMRQKIAEYLQYFNLTNMYHAKTDTLSGGQKQILNVASILLTQPKLLVLDEPLSQLDPMMQETFMHMLKKLNEEYEITIVMVEHHYDRVLPICNKIMLLEEGKLTYYGKTNPIIKKLIEKQHVLSKGLPAYYRFYPYVKTLPLSIKEARQQLQTTSIHTKIPEKNIFTKRIGQIQKISFAYDKPLIKDVSFTLYLGDIVAILGSNGSGKTTVLKILIGALKKQRGKVKLPQRIGYISQDPTSLFVKDSVYDDLKSITKEHKVIMEMLHRVGLEDKVSQHPYDLSGGEQQLLALAKVLLTKPQLLVLDEPTKGLDIHSQEKIGAILTDIRNQVSTLMVSHDVEFIAKYTNRCGMLFDGYLEDLQDTRKLLMDTTFYTTITRKICKGYNDQALLYEDITFV